MDNGKFDTKLLLDHKKLAKLSKDQLDRAFLHDLPVLGLQQSAAGLCFTALMRRASSLFYVFDSSRFVCAPKSLKDVEDLLVLMSHLLVFKRAIKENLSNWKRSQKSKTEQELFDLSQQPKRTPPSTPKCPSTVTTPPKRTRLDTSSIDEHCLKLHLRKSWYTKSEERWLLGA